MNKHQKLKQLIKAEENARKLFLEVESRKVLQPGKTEKEINQEIYALAFELFGIKKYWHKRIVRAGRNTLFPYKENPENLTLKENDILFLDFGPVFEEWEADFGRTYILGHDEKKLQLKNDIQKAWQEGKDYFLANKETITGKELYMFTKKLANKYGWQFGNEHAGHLIGNFPHEQLQGEEVENYIHPNNTTPLSHPDKNGDDRFWIYEIHFIDEELEIGGFYEQLLVV